MPGSPDTRAYWLQLCLVAFAIAVGGPFGGVAIDAQGTAPAPPTQLRATVNGSTVRLSWSAGTGGGPTAGYLLEVGSAAGIADLVASAVPATTVEATNVPAGMYFVRVRAVNASSASPPSNEIVVAVGCGPTLAAPTGLVAQSLGQLIRLRWNPVAGATGYVLEAGSARGLVDVARLLVPASHIIGEVPDGVYHTRVRALTPCGAGNESNEWVATIPATNAPIWGTVDPTVLGSCPAAVHDRYVVEGGDGYRYRTWHPQTVALDGAGTCTFAHEHGDDPARVGLAEILDVRPVMFGRIQRAMSLTMSHPEEPHEGFKVFVAVPGEVNDEQRVNRVYSLSVFHMGTGGPARFSQRFHSADIRVVHPEFGLAAFTQLMMDTGGLGVVCDPRTPGATKDVVSLGFPAACGGRALGSAYEIWRTEGAVRDASGREVYRAFANPAVFDPITVLNPDAPEERVYAWDPRVTAIKQFPADDWRVFRGCQRESYAQPGYWYNAKGPTMYFTDAMGQAVDRSAPNALEQYVSTHHRVGAPATDDGLGAFKTRVNYCGNLARLGIRN